MNAAPFPQLQVFLVVARLGSFSGAARELGVSVSAVSQTVKQFEELLQVTLLARTTRSVSLIGAPSLRGSQKLAQATGFCEGDSYFLRRPFEDGPARWPQDGPRETCRLEGLGGP